MKERLFWIGLSIILACGAARPVSVSAQEETPITDDQVNEVAGQMYCPVCENVPLDVCSTTACVQWRELIREKISQGWTDEQIKEYFANQYGDQVLATPPRKGINWLVYLLPPAVILAGAAYLFLSMRRMRTAPQDTTIPDIADPDIERVEAELQKRKSQQ